MSNSTPAKIFLGIFCTLSLISPPAAARTNREGAYTALSEELADAWMLQNPPTSMAWNWEEAVLMIGMEQVFARNQDPSILDYTQLWVDYHIANGIRINRNDAVVPCTSALFLYNTLGDPRYLEPVDQCSTYLATRAPRLSDGAIAHTMATPREVWVDSLFMFGVFYTMEGALLNTAVAFDEVSTQFKLFHEHLVDPADRLYRHMYDEVLDRNIPTTATYWGRGNGWALASLAILLSDLPPGHAQRPQLESAFVAHAQALMAWQQPSGLWATVVNRPEDTYEETSATGLFSFGLLRGYALGLLGEDARAAGERGAEALTARIVYNAQGLPVVTGISAATNPGPYWMYAHVPLKNDEPYGIGAVLMAFEELSRLEEL